MPEWIPSPRRPEIPGGPQSVAAVLDRALEEHPDDEALVGRHERLSFAALDAQSNQAAHALLDLGIRTGDRVAATLPNQPDLVTAFFGAMRIGAVWVGINRALSASEKAYMLADCGVAAYLCDEATVDSLASERSSLPALQTVLTVDTDGRGDYRDRLASMATGRPDSPIDPFAPAAIAYTSGTTGFPKGAIHSQHNLLLPGALQRAEGRDRELRLGVCLPLTLLNLMILGPIACAQIGCCCVAMDRVDAIGLADWIERERLATFAAVPTMIHDLLHHPDVRPEQLASLTRPGAGGAALPESFRALYRERFGAEVMTSYGLTEAPTVVTRTDPEAPPIPDESGTAIPYLDVHIRDEAGKRLPAGEVGEICLAASTRGPWAGVYTPMLGYWGRPDETAHALRDGVLYTGDLGQLDEDGRLFVKDRRGDLILRGGANVYPAEVERVLQTHPAVAACAVVGVDDDRLGQRVIGFVELEGDPYPADISLPEALRDHVAAQLASYKVPERIEIVREFPRSPMGKIQKNKIRPST